MQVKVEVTVQDIADLSVLSIVYPHSPLILILISGPLQLIYRRHLVQCDME